MRANRPLRSAAQPTAYAGVRFSATLHTECIFCNAYYAIIAERKGTGTKAETRQRTKLGRQRLVAKGQSGKSRYVPAIDGLRAFAVLAVIFYHMKLNWAPGGLAGVTVFFVISGYLISGLLIAEHDNIGRISFARFWMRRVRRIIPAVLLAIAGTVVLCALANPTLLDKARPDIVPSLLFYNNWWQIVRDLSYFQAASAPSPLTHYWSLAIEEQFYIVWPLVLAVLLRSKMGRRPLACLVGMLALASAIEMAALFDPHSDPSRIYYGTDTRAMSLLLGATLALIWPSSAFGARYGGKGERPKMRRLGSGRVLVREDLLVDASNHAAEPLRKYGGALDIAGTIALVGLVAIVVFTNGFTAFPYLGGIALTSVLSAALIAAAVVPGSRIARLLQAAPLVWIGKRSYGMYLWHYPIILVTSTQIMPSNTPWWVHLAQLGAIFVVSDLSYRFVEDPIRKGAVGSWLAGRRQGAHSPQRTSLKPMLTIAVAAAVFAGAAIGLATVAPPETQPTNTAVSALTAKAIPQVRSAKAAEQRRLEAELAKKRKQEHEKAVKNAYQELVEVEHLNKEGKTLFEPLLMGDSVAAGAIEEFYKAFPHGCIDAVVNRNIWENPYAAYAEAGQVGTYVIFCLGTNNAATDEQADEMIEQVAADKKVILVNTRSPREWVAATNDALARAAERHSNVIAVIDWYSESQDHPEYFWDDGIHLRPEGAKAYIDLVKRTIRNSIDVKV